MGFIADPADRFHRDPDAEMIEYRGRTFNRGTVVGYARHLLSVRLCQVPVAYIELRRDAGSVTEAELIAHLSGQLPRTQMPLRVIVLDRLPRTGSTKVSLAALRARASADVKAIPA